MSRALTKITLVIGLVSLLTNCTEKESPALFSGQVICRGGCWPNAYYVAINSEEPKGTTQAVFDADGVNRGQFNNVLLINNLKTSDQQEGKTITFKNYKDTEVSCQSSYPRAIREIEITY
ncbi:hypothetical protein [Adhaeribacter pallidiroseus]|uniref:Uncharacterized protein n=1 Tax=Adhaeribacter pallidiroseus TaxID=2072847 RepID=A0A369QNY2_9BACT|nr:hypothetical protein [Adhaeribacter pallidiroseus]RDC64986.1 hypothetical protein AHMF7616_03608 [Adhaeribacter pallidiroseus]